MSNDDTKAAKPDKKRVWTVLLYMAGDNNLSEECVYSLTEIKDAIDDSVTDLIVLAQFDPSGVRAETKRYQLRSKKFKLDDDAKLTGWKARETDTGEPHNLLEFIRWGISQHPADNFLVVLVGHGSGTEDDFLLRDENPPNALSIPELHEVFKQLTNDGHKIDILGFDTCLMNMAEVCFELHRTNVTYLVGSEGFAPNTGWPYAEILRALARQIKADPKLATPQWLARLIVEEYIKFYEAYINGGVSVDQSVLEVAKIDAVKEKMFTLVGHLLDELDKDELNYYTPKQNALLLAHWEAQSYNGEVFVDLRDFLQQLAFRYPPRPDNLIAKSCQDVNKAIGDLVVRSCVAGAAFQFSNGLSTYFPWAVLSPKYGNLAWPKETKWLDFLKDYHEVTRRKGRPLRKDEPKPGRSSVPTNKGRDGRVESMRNPPAEEFVGCQAVDKSNGNGSGNGTRPTSRSTSKAKQSKKRNKKRK